MCDPIHPTVCRVHHSHSRMGDKFRTVCFIDHHLLAVCNVLEQSGAGVQILWSGTRAGEEGTFSKTITITSQRKDPQCLGLVWVPPAWVHINTGDGWCHIPGLVFPPSQVINQAFNLLQSLPTRHRARTCRSVKGRFYLPSSDSIFANDCSHHLAGLLWQGHGLQTGPYRLLG